MIDSRLIRSGRLKIDNDLIIMMIHGWLGQLQLLAGIDKIKARNKAWRQSEQQRSLLQQCTDSECTIM
jgi:hypothetical protein